MHRRFVVMLAIVAVSAIGFAGCKKKQEATEAPATTEAPAATTTAPAAPPTATTATTATGEQLFKQNCAACHPDGGNTMNPKKTLHAKDMAANNVTKPDDIVNLMRNPGTGMTKFDQATISDTDAKAIADYILATYK